MANPIGQQRLVARPERTLILFDLLIAIEWDADDAYVRDLALAADRAADYLYDATDGQMTFGQVTIVDKAEQWAAADIQIGKKHCQPACPCRWHCRR